MKRVVDNLATAILVGYLGFSGCAESKKPKVQQKQAKPVTTRQLAPTIQSTMPIRHYDRSPKLDPLIIFPNLSDYEVSTVKANTNLQGTIYTITWQENGANLSVVYKFIDSAVQFTDRYHGSKTTVFASYKVLSDIFSIKKILYQPPGKTIEVILDPNQPIKEINGLGVEQILEYNQIMKDKFQDAISATKNAALRELMLMPKRLRQYEQHSQNSLEEQIRH